MKYKFLFTKTDAAYKWSNKKDNLNLILYVK